MFKDSDCEWLLTIGCLKKTGMRLADIRRFIEMAVHGDGTIDERLELIIRQQQSVLYQIDELKRTLETLEFKEWYYKTAQAAGTAEVPRSIPFDMLPEEFREARKRLRGE